MSDYKTVAHLGSLRQPKDKSMDMRGLLDNIITEESPLKMPYYNYFPKSAGYDPSQQLARQEYQPENFAGYTKTDPQTANDSYSQFQNQPKPAPQKVPLEQRLAPILNSNAAKEIDPIGSMKSSDLINSLAAKLKNK